MATRAHSRSRLAFLCLPALAVLVAVVLLEPDSGYPHHLNVTLSDATNVVTGQEVRIGGRKVGKVESIAAVDGGRQVRLGLGLGDDAWPLTTTSRMQLRWGGTISYSNRFISLTPGARGTQRLRDGGSFPPNRFTTPVEVDTVVDTFDAKARIGLRRMLDNAAPALVAAAPPLRASLRAGPPALNEAHLVLRDLQSTDQSLATLVTSTDNVVNAAQRANPTLGQLVSDLATTLTATGDEASNVKRTLTDVPATMSQTRTTLRHASTTLNIADRLTTRLSPGISAVQQIARPLHSTLERLRIIGPDAVSTLVSLHAATPKLNPLLSLLQKRMPQIGSIASGLTEQLKCIRPYTPDILGFASNWADWGTHTDGDNQYARINPEVPLPMATNIETKSPAEMVKLFPQIRYAFPRPPGYDAGQPWFLPECGAGKDALDPSKDPEYKNRNRATGGTQAAIRSTK